MIKIFLYSVIGYLVIFSNLLYAQDSDLNFISPDMAFFDVECGGAADPVMIWNSQEKEWFLYYTQRRGYMSTENTLWGHGTKIGIASSVDGRKWRYRGVCQGDGELTNYDREVSWWAPEIICYKDTFHMYVTHVPGVYKTWSEGTRDIRHYISMDGINWKFQSVLPLSSSRCIDACVCRIDNLWYLWYKDETNGSYTFMASSCDLYNWQVLGVVNDDCSHEAPFVWKYDGRYWMIVDAWGEKGLRIYASEDGLKNWVYKCSLPGSHPAIYEIDDRLFFVRHEEYAPGTMQTAIYISELVYKDGVFIKK